MEIDIHARSEIKQYTITLILVCNLGMSVTTTYYRRHEIVAVQQATEVLLLDLQSFEWSWVIASAMVGFSLPFTR